MSISDHEVIAVLDREETNRSSERICYKCEICGRPVYWDGVFQGAYLHAYEGS